MKPGEGGHWVEVVSLPIPELHLLSGNEFKRGHWRRYWSYREKVRTIIWAACRRAQIEPQEECPPYYGAIRITSYRGRRLDYGNLVDGCKPVVDAFTWHDPHGLAYLADDSELWCEEYYEQKVGRSRQGIEGTLIQVYQLRHEAGGGDVD